jgi:acyl-CoA thioesterase
MDDIHRQKFSLNIENLLELQRLDPNTFITAHPPWLPLGAQAIYGGTLVAHCIIAAQATVQSHGSIASLHSTFVQGGKPDTSILYTVDRLHCSDLRWTRMVRASQDGQCIFIATLNFLPSGRSLPTGRPRAVFGGTRSPKVHFSEAKSGGGAEECPYVCSKLDALPAANGRVDKTKIFQWMKTRHRIKADHPSVHLASMAYMSDNYLLPTATRVHGIRWERDPEDLPETLATHKGARDDQVKLMVSLDHSIYFTMADHDFRADDWMWSEMQSPWVGSGRALVSQRIYSKGGILIATVFQEVWAQKLSEPAKTDTRPRVCSGCIRKRHLGSE